MRLEYKIDNSVLIKWKVACAYEVSAGGQLQYSYLYSPVLQAPEARLLTDVVAEVAERGFLLLTVDTQQECISLETWKMKSIYL